MAELILHHFDASPFAEKVRVALGIKGVDWAEVQIPMVMPKADLTALTGGYRKTPVLQCGADIYCDTQRIARELEARYPEPALFPADSGALCHMVAAWSDILLFRPGAGLSMGTNADLPEPILADRFAFFDILNADSLQSDLPHLFAQFRAQLERLEQLLSDGRRWLLGSETPTWADAACYAPVWMCRGNIVGADDLLMPLAALQEWEQRVKLLGHGNCRTIAADDALMIARSTDTDTKGDVAAAVYPALTLGQQVSVAPDDYGAVAVTGQLLQLTHKDIAISREDERAGALVVHFPRAGYKVEPL